MTQVTIVRRNGEELTVDAAAGQSLMEVIRDGGVDELLALCGGCCSCATCHVYVDESYLSKLSPISPDENDLLDSSESRTAASRLSCQIRVTDEIAGIKVKVAPED
jgi:2Fe-2S ferredoxin